MFNNFILSGYMASYSGLREAEGKNGTYQYATFDIRVDDSSQQSVTLTLTGDMAVQLSTCMIDPQTKVNAFIQLHIRTYKDAKCIERKVNEVRCWKLDVLDADGNVTFSCHRYHS